MLRPFRLAAVLRVRKHQEDVRVQALSDTRRRIQMTERDRAMIAENQLATLQRATSLTDQEFDGSDVHRYFQYERHLAHVAVQKDADIAQLRQEESERMEELELAVKHRRIVERLKERHDEAVTAEFNRLEQRELDEVATTRAALKRAPRKAS